MNEFLRLSGLELAELIKTKKASPKEILEAHIQRIQETHTNLNALCEDNFNQARQLAEECEEKVLTSDPASLPIYFGVPFTVKEMLSLSGFRRTGGSIHRKNEVQSYDATCVTRLKQAGAIPLGTTNVPELGFWFETNNPIYGRTNNPYDKRRTCGGSSGGEGALIGAGASPFGLGSDIGGSIRMPAGFCGVFGHKPTNRITPLTGHFPFSKEDFEKRLFEGRYPYTSVGPIAKKAKDLEVLTQLLIGPDGIDQMTQVHQWIPNQIEIKDIKVLVLEDPIFHGANRTEKDQRQAVKNAAKLFEQLGAQVQEFPAEFFKHGVQLWLNALKSTKQEKYYEALQGEQGSLSITSEFIKLLLGKADYTLPSLVVSLAEIIGLSKKHSDELLHELIELRRKFHSYFDEKTILIMPLHPRVAPKHHAPLMAPFDFIYTGIFNVLGNPATAVPMGLNDQELPLSLQIIAAPHHDRLCLSVAQFLESTFGGWIPPEY